MNKVLKDVSTAFKWDEEDARIGREIIKYEETPQAIKVFSEKCNRLTDYGYWFYLSTLWVSYTGYSDLNLWKELFSSNRPNKNVSIMKPSELKELGQLPNKVIVYRVHRPDETDWIAYTLDIAVACRFAMERKTSEITEYKVKKRDILALFLRRSESEIIVLDKTKAKFQRVISVESVNGLK